MKSIFVKIISAIIIFTDPFLFFRVFIGNDIVSAILMMLSIVFLILKFLSFSTETYNKNKFKNSLLFIVLFSLYSSLIYLNTSISSQNLFLHLIKLLILITIVIGFKSSKGRNILLQSMFIAMIYHFIAIIPFGFIFERLDSYTNYSAEDNIIFGSLKRSTGFFTAPGYLILFSSLSTFIGYKIYLKDGRLRYLILGLVLGLTTFSRSFLMILFILLLVSLKNIKLNFKFFFICIIVVAGYTYIEPYLQLYIDYIELRFQSDSLENSNRLNGRTGLYSSLESIKNNFFGSAISINGGSLQLKSVDGIFLDPHVGIIYLFGIYGIPLGILISIIVTKLLIPLKSLNIKNSFFGVSFIAVNIICLLEPLMEHPIYLFTCLGLYYEKK